MVTIIIQLLNSLITGSMEYISTMLLSIVDVAIYAERGLDTLLGFNLFERLSDLFYQLGISLIIFKALKRGFDKYIVWSDGDPESDTGTLIIGFVKALIVAICFTIFYDWGATIIESLTKDILNAIDSNSTGLSNIVAITSPGLIESILNLIFFIFYFMLYFQFIKTGIEILILRIGFPIACMGLMDKDGGVFKAYTQKLYQCLIGVMVQLVLLEIGAIIMSKSVMSVSGVITGIATMSAALSTPKFLQEFVVTGGNGAGGGLSKMYYSSMMIKSFKSFIK